MDLDSYLIIFHGLHDFVDPLKQLQFSNFIAVHAKNI